MRAKRALEPLPAPDLVGEDVVHPLDGAKIHKSEGLCSAGRSGSIRIQDFEPGPARACGGESGLDFAPRHEPVGPLRARKAVARGKGEGDCRATATVGRRVRPFRGASGRCAKRGWLMRVAAVDLGSVRVGVAVSDELGTPGPSAPVLGRARTRKSCSWSWASSPARRGSSGFSSGSPSTCAARRAGPRRGRAVLPRPLAAATGREVELVDERLTTVEAARRHARGGHRRAARSRAHRRSRGGRASPGVARSRSARARRQARRFDDEVAR